MDSNTSGITARTGSQASVPAATSRTGSAAATVETDARNSAATQTGTTDGVAPRDPLSLNFQVDGHRVITTIVDENDHTVVAQIPDPELIRIAKAIDRMQGFFVQVKA